MRMSVEETMYSMVASVMAAWAHISVADLGSMHGTVFFCKIHFE